MMLSVMIFYFWWLLTGVLASNGYRSRFHPDYFRNNLDYFYRLRPADGSKLKAVLDACAVVLPYRTRHRSRPDADEVRRLMEAHQWKAQAFEFIWSNPTTSESLLYNEEMAHGLMVAVLENLLGEENELLKPSSDNPSSSSSSSSPSSDSAPNAGIVFSMSEDSMSLGPFSSFDIKMALSRQEPAFEVHLSSMYDFLNRLYMQCRPGTALWMELHKDDTVHRIAKLLYSPDQRERGAARQILTGITKGLIVNLGGNYEMQSMAYLGLIARLIRDMGQNMNMRKTSIFMAGRISQPLIHFATEYGLIRNALLLKV